MFPSDSFFPPSSDGWWLKFWKPWTLKTSLASDSHNCGVCCLHNDELQLHYLPSPSHLTSLPPFIGSGLLHKLFLLLCDFLGGLPGWLAGCPKCSDTYQSAEPLPPSLPLHTEAAAICKAFRTHWANIVKKKKKKEREKKRKIANRLQRQKQHSELSLHQHPTRRWSMNWSANQPTSYKKVTHTANCLSNM